MKTRFALGLAAAALVAACTTVPTWDNSTFPPQPTYGAATAGVLHTQLSPGE